MKSVCLKTNNKTIINYLLNQFENIDLSDTFISVKDFLHYKNIILHYKGLNSTLFTNTISNILSKTIIYFFEKDIISKSISLNYFYFSNLEKKKIIDNTLQILDYTDIKNNKYDLLNNSLFNYLINNHSLYLNGFINFRLFEYINFLNNKLDDAVNRFLIDKEYSEFVNILRLYIDSESQNSSVLHLHLIYKNNDSIIINDNKEIVTYNENIIKAKFVSDISFSSNDLALNTLLNLVPRKITVHLIDDYADEFINTLQLIFQNRIDICVDCNICDIYKYKNLIKK